MPRALIQNHAQDCKGKQPAARTTSNIPSSAQSQSLSVSKSQPPLCHGDCQSVPPTHQQAPGPQISGDAFSVLMSEQRDRSQVWVFFLEHLPDGTWQAHWWTKGAKAAESVASQAPMPCVSKPANAAKPAALLPCSPSVWSATTQISASILQYAGSSNASNGKAKLTVELQINVLPGSEADLAQLTGTHAGRSTFKGSPSLLKSALQKNVRLCRAAPAVR